MRTLPAVGLLSGCMCMSLALALSSPSGTSAYFQDVEVTKATVSVCEGATRSQGYWSTHPDVTEHVLLGHLDGRVDTGWRVFEGIEQVLGVLLANPAKTLDGGSRTDLNKARVLCSRQLVATVLSEKIVNGALPPIDDATGLSIDDAAWEALISDDADEIMRLASLLKEHIEEHCKIKPVFCDGVDPSVADPKGARDLADLSVVDP